MNGQTGRIVVGFDGSTHAAQAVEWAAAEAARRGTPLTVFYVIDYGRFVGGGSKSGGVGWAAYLADEPAKLLVDQGVELARKGRSTNRASPGAARDNVTRKLRRQRAIARPRSAERLP